VTKPDNELVEALSACAAHARDLVEAAKAVQSTGRSNIAYHFALEEMGKRELYEIQAAITAVGEPPASQIRATDDHKTELFWCLYGFGQISDIADQPRFFGMRAAAADIHANRIAGLYVEKNDGGLRVPAKAILPPDRPRAPTCASSWPRTPATSLGGSLTSISIRGVREV
jgi:AbiV family abortive infection protein